MDNYTQSLARLVNIMNDLREKCPWDKKQTIHSLRTQSIEELYELADAIIKEDWNGIKEELGDLLLHIIFYSKIGTEQEQFTLGDVIETVCNKLVYRHPHIYSNVKVEDEKEVKQNWEKLKLKEGKKSVLSGVPDSLPALVKATRIQEKVKQVGFEWDNTEDVFKKIQEELEELKEAVANQDEQAIKEEFGDVMFSMINYARFVKVDPETALETTNRKFKARFELMESMAKAQEQALSEMSLEEMDELWEAAKAQLKLKK